MANGTVNLLVVDDDDGIRRTIRQRAKTDPRLYVVAEAVDARTAVEAATKHEPDVVLLDLGLPGTHGLTVLDAIHERLPEVPIVLWANRPAMIEEEARQHGAAACVGKAIGWDRLAETLVDSMKEGEGAEEVGT